MAQGNGREQVHPIRVVAQRTGLTPAALRAWERRYGVVEPIRSEGGHRLYRERDVKRLIALRRAVDGGRSIGQIAELSTDELERLIAEDHEYAQRWPSRTIGVSGQGLLERSISAVEGLDPDELNQTLRRAALALPVESLVDELLVPLLVRMGASWRQGLLGPANEHVASGVIRGFLDWLIDSSNPGRSAPLLISGTPVGQVHEFGALLVTVTAASEGWRIMHLGTDLPAEEIVNAALARRADVLALSGIHPVDPRLSEELQAIRDGLPASVRIVIGGPAFSQAPAIPGVTELESIREFRASLRSGALLD
jgi:DNA-binding transcriptional MerR regulator